MGRVFLFILALLCGALQASPGTPVCPVPDLSPERHIGLGMELAILHPNHLPDFDNSLLTFGPAIALPIGGDVINFWALYGAESGLSSYLLEANYQLMIPNPFLKAFIQIGGDYLHYTLNSVDHGTVGFNAGVGMVYDVSRLFGVSFTGKMYYQQRWILGLGGGFMFFL